MLLGYNTNGLAHHDPLDAIELLAGIGFRSVAITIDHGVLSPRDDRWRQQLGELRAALQRHGMRSVIETGARFLLDPPATVEHAWDAESGFFWARLNGSRVNARTPFNLFPLITGQVADRYRSVTALSPDGFLARWLLITAVLFGGSALLFVLRLRRAAKERPPTVH